MPTVTNDDLHLGYSLEHRALTADELRDRLRPKSSGLLGKASWQDDHLVDNEDGTDFPLLFTP